MSVPLPTAADAFALLLRCITRTVAARTGAAPLTPLIALVVNRLRDIIHQVFRIAARVQAGRYAPRKSAPRRPPAAPRPRTPSLVPRTPGWLLKIVPETVGHRSHLEILFRDPRMAALMAAAPASLGRPIRSVCRMLGVPPPPVLTPPKRPRPPPKPRPAPPEKAIPPRPWPPPEAPHWMRTMRSSIVIPRMRGPPRRA